MVSKIERGRELEDSSYFIPRSKRYRELIAALEFGIFAEFLAYDVS